jgi:predicted glycoside hydrolase/deacetylase ChbG (UPF0249 family)
MARRRVVFVADDLGVSTGVDDGIAAAARAGAVREASLCVTGGAVEHGVRIAKELGLGIGLHLCFTLGRALSGPIRGLTDAAGRFGGLGRALLRCQLRLVDRDGVLREVDAQLARLRELGVSPTHANGHHHAHCWPVVRDVCFERFARAGIRWTRSPAELRAVGGGWLPLPLVLAQLARGSRRAIAAAGLRTLPFVGSTLEGRTDHAAPFRRALGCLPDGDCEWMVHPRVPDAEFARLDPLGARLDGAARAELATLTDPATAARLRELGIEPVGYPALG